jgi:hypothetical protein
MFSDSAEEEMEELKERQNARRVSSHFASMQAQVSFLADEGRR